MLDFKPTEDIISMSEFRTTLAEAFRQMDAAAKSVG